MKFACYDIDEPNAPITKQDFIGEMVLIYTKSRRDKERVYSYILLEV